MTYGEHRASDQNVDYFMPPLDKSDAPFARWSWRKSLALFCAAALAGWAPFALILWVMR